MITSYSCRIIWLKAASSNNNPRYIAKFYVNCVQKIGGKCCASIYFPYFNRSIYIYPVVNKLLLSFAKIINLIHNLLGRIAF